MTYMYTYIHAHIYTYTCIRLIPVLAEGQFTQLGVSLLSGAVAGVIATVVSQPADAVLTRMKVCVCVSMCLCTNTLLHTHLLERTLLVRAREYACIAARTRTHTHARTHTRTHPRVHTHTHKHADTHMHTHKKDAVVVAKVTLFFSDAYTSFTLRMHGRHMIHSYMT